MIRLPKVRSGLARLRLFRVTVRLGIMGSTVLSILLWTLATAFVLDLKIHMGLLERGIVLVAAIGVAIWTIVRHLIPALRIHESETLLAVMVDGKQGMHSDLVAAIQFDDERRAQYGSAQLRNSVVERTGKVAGGMNFLEGFSRTELMHRLLLFVVTLAICGVPGIIYSDHTRAFLNRLLLGSAHYPTQTEIRDILSPGETTVEGRPIIFRITAHGKLPESGRVEVETADGETTRVDLRPDSKLAGAYIGTLGGRARDDLSYTVYLGDAVPRTGRVSLNRLPRVELDMEIVAPSYAHGWVPAKKKSRRLAAVLEGSRVTPIVSSDKEIASATLVIEKDNEKDKRFAMKRRKDGKFVLADPDDPDCPLARVTENVSFHVEVVDKKHGLSPENPLRGVVQVTTDRSPRVALAAYSEVVVPDATPEVVYRAADDFGLDQLILHVVVRDAEGNQTEMPSVQLALPAGRKTTDTGRRSYKLALANIKPKLLKGYKVAVTVEAVDYRGTFKGAKIKGKSRRSVELIFAVSDKAGVREAVNRLSEQTDKKLDEILRAQVEAGR